MSTLISTYIEGFCYFPNSRPDRKSIYNYNNDQAWWYNWKCKEHNTKGYLIFLSCRATTATPTNSTRATPTHAMPLSMRRRSPSPVVTGNVSRARMRFESGGSVKNNKTSPSPVPSGFEISSKYSLTGLEPLTSSQHQTLPRTFRFMNNNHNNNTSSMDTIYRPDTKTTINKFLSGSNYANNINTVIIL